MATKYLLQCECGKEIPVEAARSGETVLCQCGKGIEIPPLRVLKTLEVAPQRQRRSDEPTGWSRRGARILLCSLFTIAMIVLTAYLYQTRPRPTNIDGLSPSGSWRLWMYYRNRVSYQPSKVENERVARVKAYRQRILISSSLVGVGILGILLSAILTRDDRPKKVRRIRRTAPPGG